MTKELAYRTASLLVENEQGKYLLQQRDGGPPGVEIPNPYKWCMFGGSIEEGETAENAMLREIGEELTERDPETGKDTKREFQPNDYRHILTTHHPIGQGEKIEYNVFHTKGDYRKRDFCQHEGYDMGFYSPEEIMNSLDVVGNNRKVLEEVFERLGTA